MLRAEYIPDPPAPPHAGDRCVEVFDRAALDSLLTVRSWQAGDRMIPFGARSQKKLQDIFTDDKIPRDRRHLTPVVLCGDTIVWLAGVRRAEFGRVRPGRAAVRLIWTEEDT
jgi:tRNA(Ile)-lysidine synthase